MSARVSRRLVPVGFVLAVAAGVTATLHSHWSETTDAVGRLGAGPLLAAEGAVLVGFLLTVFAWRTLLADLGSPVAWGTSLKIFAVGQVGKYIPGALWPVVAQVRMGNAAGVPAARMLTAFVLYLVVSVITGSTAGLAAAPGVLGARTWWLVLPVTLALACVACPGVVARLVGRALRATRRPALGEAPSPRGVRLAVAVSVVSWIVSGLHLWVLALALGAPPASLPTCVGGFAVATVAGSVVLIAPDGLGVREVVLLIALHPALPPPAAAVAAVASRVLLVAAEAVAVAVAVPLTRARTRRRADRPSVAVSFEGDS